MRNPGAHTLLFCCLAFLSGTVSAQAVKLSGRVVADSEPVSFAVVHLTQPSDTTFLAGALTDTLGMYQLEGLQPGTYKLSVTALGYQRVERDVVVLDANLTLDLQLEPASTQMADVAITTRKEIFETDRGKFIFNVQNSTLTSGQTALDMLRKLPGVSVNQNDQILFRGSSGINIMVDGKMTYLSGNQLANLLRSMSAEDINKIELMTTPSAEFDAAGNAGVINIVSKKNLKKGWSVDLRSAVSRGKNWMTDQSVSANFRTKRLDLHCALDLSTYQNYSIDQSGNTIQDNGSTLLLRRKNDYLYSSAYYVRQIQAGWQFLPKHRIGLDYYGYLDDWQSRKNSTLSRLDNTGHPQSSIKTISEFYEPYYYDALTLDYTYEVDSSDKTITAIANYTLYRNYSDGLMTTDSYDAQGDFVKQDVLKSAQPGFVRIFSTKADANLPFKKLLIKAGAKYAEVANDNEFRFDSLLSGNYVEVPEMSNHFYYKERIAAVYGSASRKFNHTNIDVGLRMEYTRADGYTVKQDIENRWEYAKLFPSVAIEQAMGDNHKLVFSLSRRINRPNYTDLNPVRWYSDPYFYFSGNPNLVPELAWVSAMTYSLKDKYILSVTYNQGINFMDRRLVLDDNGVTVKSMSDNFGQRHRLDFTASIPVEPWKWWSLQLFTGLNYSSYPISMLSGEKQLSLWAFNFSLQQDFSLPGKLKANLTAYFSSAELSGIYVHQPVGYMDFGIKRPFLKDKLMAQVTLSDVLNTTRYRAISQVDITNYFYNEKPLSRIVGASLTYHFGGEIETANRKKTEEQERL